MIEMLFVRHGQTHANATGYWQGWSDSPLNSTGHSEAEAIARRLAAEQKQIEALYTSPLRRALQTAQVIGTRLALSPRVLDQLKEIHFGKLEGVTLTEMEDQFPELYAQWQDKMDMTFRWPGGERRADFFARAAQACELIRTRHEGDRVIIVAHGGTIRACLAHLLPDLMERWWAYPLDNAGLSRVQATSSDARLLVLNETSHLPQTEGKARDRPRS
jgi:broad specificity phosphatase PhoE